MRLLIDGRTTSGRDPRGAARRLATAEWVTGTTPVRATVAPSGCTQMAMTASLVRHYRSKSRLNSSTCCRGPHTTMVITMAALDYMREHALAGPVVQELSAHPQRRFAARPLDAAI